MGWLEAGGLFSGSCWNLVTVFNQARKMLCREFWILSLAALVVVHNDNKCRRSISERIGKEDGAIGGGGVVDGLLEVVVCWHFWLFKRNSFVWIGG